MHPICQITVDGKPVSGGFYERLISVSCVDKDGISSDTFEIELDDGPPEFIELPSKGAIVRIHLGYRETGMRLIGTYKVDGYTAKCLPYSLSISGKAADLSKGKLKENKERHWDGKTLKDVVSQVAKENGLEAKIDSAIGAHKFDWLGQQDESDIHFLQRLASRHNANFTVKDGKLVFGALGSGLSVSGSALGTVVVRPEMVIKGTCSFDMADRTKYSKVTAYYQDKDKAKRVEVEASAAANGDSVLRLPEPYADAAEADKAASAKAKQLARGEGAVSVTVEGDTAIVAGAPLLFADVRPGLDGVPYVVDTATHGFSKKAGYRTAISGKLYDGKSGGKASSKSGTKSGGATSAEGTPAAPDSWGSNVSRNGFASPQQRE